MAGGRGRPFVRPGRGRPRQQQAQARAPARLGIQHEGATGVSGSLDHTRQAQPCSVARGEVYLPPKATRLLLQQYRNAESNPDLADLHELSAREQEVLAPTAEGFSSREIGKKLFISPKTVAMYRSRIMQKVGLSHRSELVRFALRVGFLKEM